MLIVYPTSEFEICEHFLKAELREKWLFLRYGEIPFQENQRFPPNNIYSTSEINGFHKKSFTVQAKSMISRNKHAQCKQNQ